MYVHMYVGANRTIVICTLRNKNRYNDYNRS